VQQHTTPGVLSGDPDQGYFVDGTTDELNGCVATFRAAGW
jgi:hypothetical protein